MEACLLRRQLDQHRYRAVRLGRRPREEPVRDLALHHHAPEVDARKAVEALHHDWRRDLVGEVRDELGRGRVEVRQIDSECIAEDDVHVVPTLEPFRQVRLEPAVDLDGMNVPDAVGEV